MSADEFWKDDPQLFVSYRTSFINKKKREKEEEDYKSWLNGLYTHHGNGLLILSLKQFLSNLVASFVKGKKDNTPIDTYPEKPYSELAKEEETKKIKEKKENKYKEYENSLVYFGTMKQRYLDKIKNKSRKESEIDE